MEPMAFEDIQVGDRISVRDTDTDTQMTFNVGLLADTIAMPATSRSVGVSKYDINKGRSTVVLLERPEPERPKIEIGKVYRVQFDDGESCIAIGAWYNVNGEQQVVFAIPEEEDSWDNFSYVPDSDEISWEEVHP